MIDFQYLSKGLNALARAHHMKSMAGHLGATVIAGYFIGEQRPNLDLKVYKGIEDDLSRVVRGESVFGKKMHKKSALADHELFEPFPKQKPDETLIDAIAEALAKSIGKPRASGHNVIFASLAIRALREHPDFATPAVVDGIRKLLILFDNAHPGSGYYGKKKGRLDGTKIKLPDDGEILPYTDIKGMATNVFNELIDQKPEIHRVGYGGLLHIINHAAAITDISTYGYPELVPFAVRSHRKHFRLWRNLPNVAEEKGPMKVSRFTPHTAEYWTTGNVPYDRALLTHRVKTMFGFDELATVLEEKGKEKAAYDKIRLMM
ncbi:hypothetical protein N8491_03720 [Akkermansiaceae bacterium]|nr:hypothetical protein [Akkermansiaceae bacterium]MDA7536226.1 hypothetical protein [bacterium]MDA7496886.1 hypothetical protein [Akkermansiaceae bacterium]MDA7497747.1 hypothetical protein [Akkermansiaceae bacterium]MDA7508973.1 hypothetical protein [Akkermansiaceae bacterium]